MDLTDYDPDEGKMREREDRQDCFRRALKLRSQIRKLDEKDQIILIAILRMLPFQNCQKENFSWLSSEAWEKVLEMCEYTLPRMQKKLTELETALKRNNMFNSTLTRQTYRRTRRW